MTQLETFTAPLHDGKTVEHRGMTFTFRTEFDDGHGAPWEECDGHGPVTDWTTRSKAPGELVLNSDRGSRRFYDFAEACRIARRDQWGWLPGRLDVRRNRGGWWRATVEGSTLASGPHRDINAAIREVYAAHRATMSPRAYAAKAAMRDFEYLRKWCNGDWQYIGVIVTASKNGIELATASLWGIESHSSDCIADTADELLREAYGDARDILKGLRS